MYQPFRDPEIKLQATELRAKRRQEIAEGIPQEDSLEWLGKVFLGLWVFVPLTALFGVFNEGAARTNSPFWPGYVIAVLAAAAVAFLLWKSVLKYRRQTAWLVSGGIVAFAMAYGFREFLSPLLPGWVFKLGTAAQFVMTAVGGFRFMQWSVGAAEKNAVSPGR